MKEEIIVSGRMNHMIDPVLHAWGWEIPVYLFLGGLAAGLLFFSGLYYLLGKENHYPAAVRKAPVLVPVILALGLFALFLDLHHKPYFWRLYTTIKFQSPMSWGAWTLMIVTPLSMIWAALHIKEWFPRWDWKFQWLKDLEIFLSDYKKTIAWAMALLGVILGIYTGILLSAFNARPLWNTSILGPLFLTSGLSAGSALIMLLSKDHHERITFARIDLIVIGIELFFIIHMFMGFLASTQVQIDAASIFLGGELTAPFWIFVVVLGMLVPAALEVMELRHFKVPVIIPVVLILFGSFMLRWLITNAGQLSRYLY
ncbi:MAG TPA: nitrite reductase [Marinilabiliales bacterium]|jgi:formate-dependent nitrite reductase membrane component NrfD|nr:MAG: nitrite reductase [Bacteroidetes bacterium GWA2_40_14]OFX63325.1 MAG: nitrite reductase [Bacteroidetes bacterium GWC2_40_13]OFX74633.1 MAG: nitrite reductase [Bacteroidetes bacterium GWD2_40_43]OFX93709.1 MAG: nitrite reductase [Bacteroidetes bacterium GWE2_40_63]OFY18546.1 MAG: nitrite reductase [Bacteroidetes bacterium GWF2_40_13]OFZ32097.1 MAG: nitrite reductase [Bacteroidetes bacterium RIFOXYC2_FULL_40_12]HAM99063.1 nitrite reductase [Marinilabiliales bacterium]